MNEAAARKELGGSRQEVGASQYSYSSTGQGAAASTLAPSQAGPFLLTDRSHPGFLIFTVANVPSR